MQFVQTNREELRPIVVNKALEMFFEHGFGAVRMDDIAASLSISKRTLYEMFGSKEDLLFEAMRLHREMVNATIRKTSQNEDVLSMILRFIELSIEESDRMGRLFSSKDFRNSRLKAEAESHSESMRRHAYRALELGVEQGMFREDLNLDLVMQCFRSIGKMVVDPDIIGRYQYDILVNSTVVVMLRGISTPKGLEHIENFIHNNINVK